MGNKGNKALKEETKSEGSEDRGKWAHPAEFVLSCLGYAVGLGNVWRFPYLAYVNGGGAFLIPYVLMYTFVGIPSFFIELYLGQYVQGGPIAVWSNVAPIFQGVGVGMFVITFIGCIYYNMILAWALYYMIVSWQKILPWSTCDHDYNTENCYSHSEATRLCSGNGSIFLNQTCYNGTYLSEQDPTFVEMLVNKTKVRVSASEEYFNLGMLRRSATIEDSGVLHWDLCLALLLAWVLCYVCVVRGIRSSGKVVYFTATFPYVILIIFVIRGCLLEGAFEGIKFYIIPEWSKLKTAKVWVDAAGQIFFSLSVGMGGLMTFASYNRFDNNVFRDTLIVTISDCCTSVFAGFAIFSILGHLGHILDKPVSEVATSGSGLAFIAYPEVVLWLEPPQLWATLFFFMLLMLGLDSQFAGIENIMTAIVDGFPKLRHYKPVVSLVLCVVMYFLGLTMCTSAGLYWLDIMSYYSSGWSLVLIGTCEVMIMGWCYLAKNMIKDIHFMMGYKPEIHWWVTWTFITPLLLLGILIFSFIDFTPLSFGDYVLEQWAQDLGWLMAFVSVAVIPVCAVIQIIQCHWNPDYKELSFGRKLLKLTRHTAHWREAANNHLKKKKDTENPSLHSDEEPTNHHKDKNGTVNSGFDEVISPNGDIDMKHEIFCVMGKVNPAYVDDPSKYPVESTYL